MKHLVSIAACFLFSILTFFSCSSGTCYEDTIPVVVTDIYSSETKKTVTCDSIKITGISLYGDTLITDETSVSEFKFSLDPVNTISKLIFLLDAVADTVSITYTSSPHFISPGCGYTFFNQITNIEWTEHIIDSLKIDNQSITLDGQKNLRLYY
jgi:hypothetical protein